MKNTGWFAYANQAAAEERVSELRSTLVNLVETLEDLNQSIDSHALHVQIERTKFNLGL